MTQSIVFTAATAAFTLAAGLTAAAGVSDADRSFLTKDVQGARFELALGKLAVGKASKPPVQSYAQLIVRDHATANAALMTLAKQEGVVAPSGMTTDDEKKLDKLKGLSGAAFDKAYVDEMTDINAQDESDSNKEKSSTHDRRISAYIQKFSEMDAKHKAMGENLKKVTR